MIEINGRRIGPGERCWIVAEIGCTHGGDIRTALRLVDQAKVAGADCVKFQAFNTHRLLSPDNPMYRVVLPLELSEGQFRCIKAHCDEVGITFLATPDQVEDADMLESIGVPAYKIGSGNLRNRSLLQHVASFGKPVILSTGMGTCEDVREAIHALQSAPYGKTPLVLLHCHSFYFPEGYAWKPEEINLRAMDWLAQTGHPVGFSDHSPATSIALAAVARGACVIERHIRPHSYRGLDWQVSIDPDQFEQMVRSIRQIEAALGDGVKRPQEAEAATREWVESWRKT